DARVGPDLPEKLAGTSLPEDDRSVAFPSSDKTHPSGRGEKAAIVGKGDIGEGGAIDVDPLEGPLLLSSRRVPEFHHIFPGEGGRDGLSVRAKPDVRDVVLVIQRPPDGAGLGVPDLEGTTCPHRITVFGGRPLNDLSCQEFPVWTPGKRCHR